MNNTMTDSADKSSIEESDPERLILYRSALQNCLQSISSSIKLDDFSKPFNSLPYYKKHPRLVTHFHKKLTNFLNENVYRRVEEHIQEDELAQKFSNLEKLTAQDSISRGTECWRPSHDVQKDLRSYRMQEKMAFIEELERMVTAKEDIVNKLKYEITSAENHAKKLEEQMTNTMAYLDMVDKRIEDFSSVADSNNFNEKELGYGQ